MAPSSGNQHWIFQGPDANIYDIGLNVETRIWTVTDATSAADAPTPAVGTGVTAFATGGQMDWSFQDSAGQLWQITNVNGAWGYGALNSGTAGAGSLTCSSISPEFMGAYDVDKAQGVPVSVTGLSPSVTRVVFLVYDVETQDLQDAQTFPASAPSGGASKALIGTNNFSDEGGYAVVAQLQGQQGTALCGDRAFFTITSAKPPANPLTACNWMGGNWSVQTPNEPDEMYSLQQDGTTLSGSDSVSSQTCGTFVFSVTGKYQGNGVFSFTASNPSGGNGECEFVDSITESVTVSGPGCTSGSGSWSNSEGVSGTDSWSTTDSIPTGELSQFKNWDSHGYSTEARFQAQLAGSGRELFGGREVSEIGPASDGCWDPSSAVQAVTVVDGESNTRAGLWAVQSDNTYGDDMIGYDPGVVMYYQQHRAAQHLSMPCTLSAQQQMRMQSSSGSWTTYQTNTLSATVTNNSVAVQRGSASSGSLTYPE